MLQAQTQTFEMDGHVGWKMAREVNGGWPEGGVEDGQKRDRRIVKGVNGGWTEE